MLRPQVWEIGFYLKLFGCILRKLRSKKLLEPGFVTFGEQRGIPGVGQRGLTRIHVHQGVGITGIVGYTLCDGVPSLVSRCVRIHSACDLLPVEQSTVLKCFAVLTDKELDVVSVHDTRVAICVTWPCEASGKHVLIKSGVTLFGNLQGDMKVATFVAEFVVVGGEGSDKFYAPDTSVFQRGLISSLVPEGL